jgi:hypothetical protein
MRFSLIAVAAFLVSSVPAFAQDVYVATCSDTAQLLPGDPGAAYNVSCPSGCTTSSVWGAGTYSDDSAICTAAIHAGSLGASGGTVQVVITGGLASYPSTFSNGITSSSWGSWHRSFYFGESVGGQAALPITCGDNAQALAGEPGSSVVVACPASCNSSIWGTGIYSDDSSVCTAAVHAGVLTWGYGGNVLVTIMPGQANYPPSTQFGITSSSWGSWGRSFAVTAY